MSPEVPAEKQSSITDFFSPRLSTPVANGPVLNEGESGCVMGEPSVDQETGNAPREVSFEAELTPYSDPETRTKVGRVEA